MSNIGARFALRAYSSRKSETKLLNCFCKLGEYTLNWNAHITFRYANKKIVDFTSL